MGKDYLGFMDHSITEQLIGDPDAWHTTALVISEGNGVPDLAKKIASVADPDERRLLKWTGRRRERYRTNFAEALNDNLEGSGVLIFASSGQEKVITANRDHIIRELHLAGLYREDVSTGDRKVSRIGPFVHRETRKDHFFCLPSNQAMMVLWVAHFVARMHTQLALQLKSQALYFLPVYWVLYIDKFAGDNVETPPRGQLFQAVVSRHIPYGNIRTAFFHESGTVGEDLLADNVAGLFNEWKMDPASYPHLENLLRSGLVYYESS